MAADGIEAWTYYKDCNARCPSHASSVQIVDTQRGAQQVDVPKLVFSDAAGKPVRTLTSGFDGKKVVADTEYDALGRVSRTWQPVKVNSDADALVGTVPSAAVLASEFGYDDLGRVTSPASGTDVDV